MDHPVESTSDHPAPALGPLRLSRTLRFGLRAAWDSLGFVCASSLTVFVGICAAATVYSAAPNRSVGAILGATAYLLLLPPLYAGACWLVHRVFENDEPSYADLWAGFRRLYRHAVALGAIQSFVTVVLLADMRFCLGRSSAVFLVAEMGLAYLLLFWFMNQVYHWPLLVASHAGLIRRDDGRTPGIRSVLRNGFLLTVTSPGYTLAITLLLGALAIPLLISGVGLALVLPGLAAFVTTQAGRDQFVRFRMMEPPPDPDAPIMDERWKVR